MLYSKKIAFHNLGCKVNSYELDAMKRAFTERGCFVVDFTEAADIYIINTCSVTNIADRKSRQMISRARKKNPQAVIVATGCYVETRAEEALTGEAADLCIGNNLKGQMVELVEAYLEGRTCNNKGEGAFIIKDEDIDNRYDDMHIERADEHTRAFIKVQDGCNQFCTYCIIPFARGRVRSRKKEDVINEVKALSENGYREIVITGIHISSYGSDFVNEKKCADQFEPELLLELIEAVSRVPGVERIRLGSLEPRIMTEEFTQRLSEIPGICPHFHLSLQSGCDRTLKRMNRHYDCREFMERVSIIRKYFSHPAITTDVIVGFPGESEEDFEECRSYLEKIEFYETHIFRYSKRAGTIAAGLPDQLTEKQKADRSDVLEALEKKSSRDFRAYYIGKKVSVLYEEEKEIGGEKYMTGHTPEYVKVAVKSGRAAAGEIEEVRVSSLLTDEYLLGVKAPTDEMRSISG